MNNILHKINQFRYRNLIVVSIAMLYTIFFTGCYTEKEFILEGSRLRDTTSYEDIINVTLIDSTKIKFGNKDYGFEAAYTKKYKDFSEGILYTTKIDTTISNDQVQLNKKWDFIELKNVMKAKVVKQKLNLLLTIGIPAMVLAVLIICLISLSQWKFGLGGLGEL